MKKITVVFALFALGNLVLSCYTPSTFCGSAGDCLGGEVCAGGRCIQREGGGNSNINDNVHGNTNNNTVNKPEPCPNACMGSSSQPMLGSTRKFGLIKKRAKHGMKAGVSKAALYFKRSTRKDVLKRLQQLDDVQKGVLRQLFLEKNSQDPRINAIRATFQNAPRLYRFIEQRLKDLDAKTEVLKTRSTTNLEAFFAPRFGKHSLGFFDKPQNRCAPFLSLQAKRIVVHEPDDPPVPGDSDDEIYCLFQAVSDDESQALLTPVLPSTSRGGTVSFPEEKSWIWGEKDYMYYPGSKLTVNIDCIEDDSSSRQWGKVLEGVNEFVDEAANLFKKTKFGVYLKTTKLILSVVSSLLGANEDDHLLSAKLEINEADLPQYVNKEIEIRKSGESGCVLGICTFDWDWALFIHAQYCRE